MEYPRERRGGRRLREAKGELAENPGAMFERVVPEHEVNDQCTFLRHVWRDRIFTPLVTLWTFLGQVLSADSSCREAVARALGGAEGAAPVGTTGCAAAGGQVRRLGSAG